MTGPSGGDAVTVERSGPVTTVRLSRPHVRNAGEGRHGEGVG
jgi:enoyl-CoA hydratase